jgi:DNA modification methylase
VGVGHSFEQMFQATRRCWRFGQTRPVHAHIVTASTEGRVVENLRRKEADYDEMMAGMLAEMAELEIGNLKGITMMRDTYATNVRREARWTMHLGDCVEGVRALPDASIDYSIFSPPFASLYTYSALDRDMGNCKGFEEFRRHFGYLVPELLRVTKPGRLCSFHCMNLPTSKTTHGVIGLHDFRGDLIRLFVEAGWIYHAEVVIWKDPVTAMQRTKSIRLLHKQLKKDSTMSGMGIPDYVITMRKPGENASRVSHTGQADDIPVSDWQKIASPVWMDINQSDTLQFRSAREHDDERHICPLQLEVIERCIKLWTNEHDLVLSPFAGIGSEGHVALLMGRRFVGFELKRSYYEQACRNLDAAAGTGKGQRSILDLVPETSDDDASGMTTTSSSVEAPSPARREPGSAEVAGAGSRPDMDPSVGASPTLPTPADADQQYGPAHPFRGTDGIAEPCDDYTIPADACADMAEHAAEFQDDGFDTSRDIADSYVERGGRSDDWPGPDDKIGPDCFGGSDGDDFKDDEEIPF